MDIQIDHIYSLDALDHFFNVVLLSDFNAAFSQNYEAWRSQTLESLLMGRKVAIGAWTVPDQYSGKREDLAGVCILKKVQALTGPELQLELLYVDEKYRNPHHYPNALWKTWNGTRHPVGFALLSKAEELCRKYGYNYLITKAPIESTGLVLFFLHNQFIVSEYDVTKDQYYLLKKIEQAYNKDPFDSQMVINWVCRKWGIEVEEWQDSNFATGQLKFNNSLNWNIRVDLLICKNLFEIQPQLRKTTSPIRIIFITSESSEDVDLLQNDDTPTFIITPTDLRREAQNPDIDLLLQDYISAVLVPINKEHFDRLNPDKEQVFLDGGEYGLILDRKVRTKDDRFAFIVFSNSTINNQEVLGVGRIRSIAIDTPELLWNQVNTMSTFKSSEEFARYRNIKTRMTAISFDQLEIHTEIIDFGKELSRGGWHYLSDEDFYRLILAQGKYPNTLNSIKPKSR